MAKLSLDPNPTFQSNVLIPVPGKKPASVGFTFKWRTRADFNAWLDAIAGRDDVDVLMDVLGGWELDDAFERENVERLTQTYIGSARAILDKYIAENCGARLGN